MFRRLIPCLVAATFLAPIALGADQAAVIAALKKSAEAKPGGVNRNADGAFYFKYLTNPVGNYDKAYFKYSELTKGGKKSLAFAMIKNTPGGVQLTMLIDNALDGKPTEAYVGGGKTLADADRAIASNPGGAKIPVTMAHGETFRAAVQELGNDLGVK